MLINELVGKRQELKAELSSVEHAIEDELWNVQTMPLHKALACGIVRFNVPVSPHFKNEFIKQ